jgi:hypothetical protein
MISLLESEHFKRDYANYKNQISNIQREDLKQRANDLLNKLISEIKMVDLQHQELFATHKMPMRLEESKKKILDIRKELDRFLKDCTAIKSKQSS